MNTYTIWLIPPIEVINEYQAIIDVYSQKLSTPSFEPHITLTGGIGGEKEQVIQSIQKVTDSTRPIDITISEISISTTYFQCVFARVTPTPQLLDLHMALRSACNMVAEYFYMPHMSLIYGDIKSDEKQTIAKKIDLSNKQFTSRTIYLMDSQSKDTSTWKHIAEFALSCDKIE